MLSECKCSWEKDSEADGVARVTENAGAGMTKTKYLKENFSYFGKTALLFPVL